MSIDIKGQLASRLAEPFNTEKERVLPLIEIPPNPDFGDFAVPCFFFAKTMKKKPADIAIEVSRRIASPSKDEIIARTEAVGPYLNIFIDRGHIAGRILGWLLETDFDAVRGYGAGETVLIDYSSPNIAKPFGIGHLRSTVIGSALKKIYGFLGYNAVGINHLGDWGTQFGNLISAFKRWGSVRALEASNPVKYLYELYVRFHREAESDPELEKEGRDWFSRLEKGDPEARELWGLFTRLSIEEFTRVYERLGVTFEHYTGESFYEDKLDGAVEEVVESGITEISDGALIVPFGDDDTPALLRKNDGSTLYLTRDIAAALYRYVEYQFGKVLYVVGSPQILHFKQLVSILERMGKPWASSCVHVPFGQIRFREEAMSTRKGNIVFLEDVLDRAVDLALRTIEEKNPELENKRSVAEAVGVGSVIFNDLKNYRTRDITFDWDEILNFNGETGVYVQYTYARACSLLKKYEERYGAAVCGEGVEFPEEVFDVSLVLNNFEDTVLRAAGEYEPSVIARYLLDLASLFNGFYNTHRVITDDPELSLSRALLVSGVRKILETGLQLIGIEPVEKM